MLITSCASQPRRKAMRTKHLSGCVMLLGAIATPVESIDEKNLVDRSVVHKEFQPFCKGGPGVKRATASEIAYAGNLGSPNHYGCNLILVDDIIADRYRYTINMTNAAAVAQSCVCWLKIGPHGGLSGFFKGNEVLSFAIPTEGHQVLAVDGDSQGGCTCSSGAIQVTSFGQFGGTWLEFDMGSKPNHGCSGADASCLVSASNGLEIPGLRVCSEPNGVCSTIHAGGTGENAYLQGMEFQDGIGINLSAREVRLTATFGYQK